MKYDFTTIIDRHGMDARAVDGLGGMPGVRPEPPKEGFDVISMWVADMNFATMPAISEAIVRRAQHSIYGYCDPSDEYYNAIINWQKTRNGAKGLTRACIGYENGVLCGLISAMGVLCSPGDHVLVHSPTYAGFTDSMTNAGYYLVYSPLKQDAEHVWRMDLADMEQKIVKNKIHAAILCSPHNPTGRVWERWELEQAMELFRKYDVKVVSDEIWSDLTLEGYKHIPTQSISEDARNRTVATYAPSKTFNLAGLVGGYHIIYNETLRDRIEKQFSVCQYNTMNVLSMHVLIAAYTSEGAEWLGELRQVLTENVRWASDYIRTHFEGVELADPQGTYMLFLDCTRWCEMHGKSLQQLLRAGSDVGVAGQDFAARRFIFYEVSSDGGNVLASCALKK